MGRMSRFSANLGVLWAALSEQCGLPGVVVSLSPRERRNPCRCFNNSPEVIRLAAMKVIGIAANQALWRLVRFRLTPPVEDLTLAVPSQDLSSLPLHV